MLSCGQYWRDKGYKHWTFTCSGLREVYKAQGKVSNVENTMHWRTEGNGGADKAGYKVTPVRSSVHEFRFLGTLIFTSH